MGGVYIKDRRTSDELSKLVVVKHITALIRSGHQKKVTAHKRILLDG